MHARSPRFLALGIFVLLVGCSRCGDGSSRGVAGPLSRVVPRAADAVILVPNVGRVGEKLTALQKLELVDFVAPTLGATSGRALVDGLVRQVGIDPRSREDLEKAGLDSGGGAAVVVLPEDVVYLVVPVKDATAFQERIAQLAKRVAGSALVSRVEADGIAVTRFATAEGAPPRVALAQHDKWAFVAAGPGAARVAEFAALPPEKSLDQDPVFAGSRARLSGDHAAVAFIPGGSRFLPQGTVAGITLAASLGLSGLTVRADAPWPDRLEVLQAITPQPGAPDLSGYLPRDAVAVARYSGDPARLEQYWPHLVGPSVTRALQNARFDLKAEVLDNLKPGAVASLSLSPGARMTGMPALDMRRTNPFDYAHLTVVAEARDGQRVAGTLQRVPPMAKRLGAELTPAERGGLPVLLTRYGAGEGAHLAAVGTRLLMAAPEARLLEGLERLKGAAGPAPLSTQLMTAMDGKGLAVVVDLRKLSDAVRALPPEAWGIGGFAIKPATVRWLDAMHELTAVVATVTAKEKAIQAELTLQLEVKRP